jgi:hypothetical protein
MQDLEFIYKATNAIAMQGHTPLWDKAIAETVSREIHRLRFHPAYSLCDRAECERTRKGGA